MTKRQEIMAIMQSWVGQRISDGTPSPIIDLYNTQKPLPRGYKVAYTDPACATTVSAAAIKAGVPASVIPRECSCSEMINLLKNIGSWQEDDKYVPKPGDILFYDWDDSATNYAATDNVGAPEHVGIVESVTNGQITVIEGNKGKMVGRRAIAVNGRFIRGYGVPKYPDDLAAPRKYNAQVTNAVADIALNSPDYWQDVLEGKKAATVANLTALMDKYHAALAAK